METKGYMLEQPKYEPVVEDTLVGCKYCRETWIEKHRFTDGIRINGPMFLYDACSFCYDFENEKWLEEKV